VKREVDCRVFGDQMEELVRGSLQEEGARQLRLHARDCPDCAMQLKVHEHLVLPALEELEASVPEELLAGVWTGVEARMEEAEGNRGRRTSRGRPGPLQRPWLVPSLAAASTVLLFSTGFLLAELKQSQGREEQLARQVGEMGEWLGRSGTSDPWVARTARLTAGRNLARALDFGRPGQDYLELATLSRMLQAVPEDKVLLRPSLLEALTRIASRPNPSMRELMGILGEPPPGLGDARGVRAGDLLEWLAALDLPPDTALPKSPLLELLS
jgi:hypothetical protein